MKKTLFVLLTFFFCSDLKLESRKSYDFRSVKPAFMAVAE